MASFKRQFIMRQSSAQHRDPHGRSASGYSRTSPPFPLPHCSNALLTAVLVIGPRNNDIVVLAFTKTTPTFPCTSRTHTTSTIACAPPSLTLPRPFDRPSTAPSFPARNQVRFAAYGYATSRPFPTRDNANPSVLTWPLSSLHQKLSPALALDYVRLRSQIRRRMEQGIRRRARHHKRAGGPPQESTTSRVLAPGNRRTISQFMKLVKIRLVLFAAI